LAGSPLPTTTTINKLGTFLDTEAKRLAQGNGIRPTEPADQNREAAPIFALCSALSILPKSAGQNSVNRPKHISGDLPEVWSNWSDARKPSGSAQGVE
jgi:hypothetical protein